MSKPWLREYSCGCREALDEGVGTDAADTCPKHGNQVIAVGFLTDEGGADGMLETLREIAARTEPSIVGPGSTGRGSIIHTLARAAIAKATGDES